MPTPPQFGLVVPHYKPTNTDQHEQNLRAIKRTIDGLPFARYQRLVIAYDTDPDNPTDGTLVAEGTEESFVLYDLDGYEVYERGVFNTIVTVETVMAFATTGDYVSMRLKSGTDFEIYSFHPEGLKVKRSTDTSIPGVAFYFDVTTFQGSHDAEITETWVPEFTVEAMAGDVYVKSVSVLHAFYPFGIMNTLRFDKEHN